MQDIEADACAQLVVEGALTFDPTQDQSRGDGDPLGVLYSYMESGQDTWIFPRPVVNLAVGGLTSGRKVVIHGETGCGKTSIVRVLMRSFTGDDSETTIPLLCDFNYETLGAVLGRPDTALRSVVEAVRERLDEALSERHINLEVKAELRLLLLRRSDKFEAVRDHLELKGLVPLELDAREFSALTDADDELVEIWKEAYGEYRKDVPSDERLVDQFRALLNTERDVVLVLDNVDDLPRAYELAIAKVARGFSQLARYRSGALIACRTENAKRLRDEIGTTHVTSASVMPYPDVHSWDVRHILLNRLQVANESSLHLRLIHAGLVVEADKFSDAVVRHSHRVEVTMNEVWELDRDASNPSSAGAAALVSWHNGNIRRVSESILKLSSHEVDTSHLGPDHPTTRRRAKNRMYRHIVVGDDVGPNDTALSPVLELFVANSEQTAPHRPFYFLRYRLLAHLAHKGIRTLTEVMAVFQSFGVKPERVVDALEFLSRRSGHDSGLLRLTDAMGIVERLDTGDSDDVQIELLPAGAYVAGDLILTCEYLYWAALQHHDCREEIKHRMPRRAKSTSGRLPSDRDKVMVSTIILRHYLLPRFAKEHPYMTSDTYNPVRDGARLDKFMTHFGYQRDNWFIKRLRLSISTHANSLDMELPDWVQTDLKVVERSEERLDQVYDSYLSS